MLPSILLLRVISTNSINSTNSIKNSINERFSVWRAGFGWQGPRYGQHFRQEYGSTRYGCQSCSRPAEKGWTFFPPSPLEPRPSRPASACSASTLRLNMVLTHGITPAFHVYRQPPSGQSRVYCRISGQSNAYRWRSLPRVHWPRTTINSHSPQGSSSNGCCLFRLHRRPMNVRRSFQQYNIIYFNII